MIDAQQGMSVSYTFAGTSTKQALLNELDNATATQRRRRRRRAPVSRFIGAHDSQICPAYDIDGYEATKAKGKELNDRKKGLFLRDKPGDDDDAY